MFAELMSKTPRDSKEKREELAQFIKDRGWGDHINWHTAEHKSCQGSRRGHWRATNWGFYQSADWQWRWFLGYRCTTCGMMVQFSQIANQDGDDTQPLVRNVIVP